MSTDYYFQVAKCLKICAVGALLACEMHFAPILPTLCGESLDSTL